MNPLEEFFNLHFNPNQVYSNQEIRDIFQNADIPIPNSGNPTAFTYNRWNLGMTVIFPVFEYLGNSKYRYLGHGNAYNGNVYHCPRRGPQEIIAIFNNGVYNFLQEGVLTLQDWKNHYNLD